jgi:hypothetical protein
VQAEAIAQHVNYVIGMKKAIEKLFVSFVAKNYFLSLIMNGISI